MKSSSRFRAHRQLQTEVLKLGARLLSVGKLGVKQHKSASEASQEEEFK